MFIDTSSATVPLAIFKQSSLTIKEEFIPLLVSSFSLALSGNREGG